MMTRKELKERYIENCTVLDQCLSCPQLGICTPLDTYLLEAFLIETYFQHRDSFTEPEPEDANDISVDSASVQRTLAESESFRKFLDQPDTSKTIRPSDTPICGKKKEKHT